MNSPIKINQDKCIGCLSCTDSCPVDAIGTTFAYVNNNLNDIYVKINPDICISEGSCITSCPYDAIEGYITPPWVLELEKEALERYKNFIKKANEVIATYTVSKMKKIVDDSGVIAGVKELSHTALKQVTRLSGFEPITEVQERLLESSFGPLKKIAAIGTVVNGLTVVVSFSDGDITEDDLIKAGKFVLFDVLTFIPGPIGMVATGVSFGYSILESR